MLGQKKGQIICFACKKPISGARTVINEQWHCADCTYRIDHPDAVIPEPGRPKRLPPGNQHLFDPDPLLRRKVDVG